MIIQLQRLLVFIAIVVEFRKHFTKCGFHWSIKCKKKSVVVVVVVV